MRSLPCVPPCSILPMEMKHDLIRVKKPKPPNRTAKAKLNVFDKSRMSLRYAMLIEKELPIRTRVQTMKTLMANCNNRGGGANAALRAVIYCDQVLGVGPRIDPGQLTQQPMFSLPAGATVVVNLQQPAPIMEPRKAIDIRAEDDEDEA